MRSETANVSALQIPGRSSSSKSDKKNKNKGKKCMFCDYIRHVESECHKKKASSKEAKGKAKTAMLKPKDKASSTGILSGNANTILHTPSSVVESTELNEFVMSSYTQSDHYWMADSGCTLHITPYKSDFTSFTEHYSPSFGTLANKNSRINFLRTGHVQGEMDTGSVQ